MDKIVQQLKRQQEINFKNMRDQIEIADLEAVFDNENNSRYIFHYLHSMDRFFMNPSDYVYEGDRLFGIDENLSVIDPAREGYIEDTSIVIPMEKLLKYLDYIESKINAYFETLTPENLVEAPEGFEVSRLELILSQFRHQMWHVGLSSAITFNSKKEWNEFSGLTVLQNMIKMKQDT